MKKHQCEPILLAVPEACEVLSIGTTKLYALIAHGQLAARKIGRKTLFLREDLERFAKELDTI